MKLEEVQCSLPTFVAVFGILLEMGNKNLGPPSGAAGAGTPGAGGEEIISSSSSSSDNSPPTINVKNPNVYQILCVGDSLTAGLFMNISYCS
jgi:hypothetical protein